LEEIDLIFIVCPSQILFMDHGHIVEAGPPHQVLPKVSSEIINEEPKETTTPPSR